MTGKLIKFEFRSSFRFLVIIWAALLAMTILMCILVSVSGLRSYDQFIHSMGALMVVSGIVKAVSALLYGALFASLVVLTIGIVVMRFYKGLLGEEGYLMHTLPVKEWQLITAKGVVAACAVIGSMLVGMISILLLSNSGGTHFLGELIANLNRVVTADPKLLLIAVEFLILCVASLLKSIYQIYAAISIGQLVNRHRVLASLGAYLGISIVLMTLAGILFSSFSQSNMWYQFSIWIESHSAAIPQEGLSGSAPSQVVMLVLFLMTAVQLAAFHVVTERLLTKKLNLL